MPHCEMCGADVDALTKVKISQAELEVCDECEDLGEPVERSTTTDTDTKYSTSSPSDTSNDTSSETSATSDAESMSPPSLETTELRADYGEVIRDAREAHSMTLEDLADQLGEKESHIRKVEHGERRPTEALQHEIEEALDIDLTSESDFNPEESSSSGTGQTLGDVVDFENE